MDLTTNPSKLKCMDKAKQYIKSLSLTVKLMSCLMSRWANWYMGKSGAYFWPIVYNTTAITVMCWQCYT